MGLPTLDPDLVALVKAEQPDQIQVGEHNYPVDYASGEPVMQVDGCNPDHWMSLPDEGVFLQNGHRVGIMPVRHGYSFTTSLLLSAERHIPTLKRELSRQHGDRLFEQWQRTQTLPLPDAKAAGSEIPLQVESFGHCPLTGEPLIAYCTLTYRNGRFQTLWHRDEAVVLAAFERANAELWLRKIAHILGDLQRQVGEVAEAVAGAPMPEALVAEARRLRAVSESEAQESVAAARQWAADAQALLELAAA